MLKQVGLKIKHNSVLDTLALKPTSSAAMYTAYVAILCDVFNIGFNMSVVGNILLSVTDKLFF